MDPENVTQPTYDDELNEEDISCDTTILRTLSLVISCVAFVVGTIGNGLVIYVTGFRMKTTVNSVWFLNLALADFLFTVFLIISIINISIGQEKGWIFGDLLCKCNGMVNGLNMFASILILAAISLDRCLSAWVVVWAQNKRTPRKAQFTCVGIWLAALVCSLPLTVFRKVEEFDGKMVCYLDLDDDPYRDLIVFRFVVGFLIPFLVIIGSNVAIWMRTRKFQRRSRRSTRIIIAVILAFFTCWLPFHIFQFLDYNRYVVEVSHTFNCVVDFGLNLSNALAFLNSCINPILYVFMCAEFQKKLRQSVCLVFESALAEDHTMSLTSLRTRSSRKSDSQVPMERKGTAISLTTSSD